MKISYLHIRNYKQFSDLELDLTYPKGHKKAGQPLDKICIIGQSGTGKTNLLDIIKKSTVDFSGQPKNTYLPFLHFTKGSDSKIISKFITQKNYNVESKFSAKNSKITFRTKTNRTKKNNILEHEKNYFVDVYTKETDDSELLTSRITINNDDKKRIREIENKMTDMLIEANGDYSLYDFEFSMLNNAKKSIEDRYIVEKKLSRKLEDEIEKSIININNKVDNIWVLAKNKITQYSKDRSNYILDKSNKMLVDNKYTDQDFKKDIAIWEKSHENLLEKLADDLNLILEKFNLKLKIDDKIQSYDRLHITDLSNLLTIEYDNLSTGTKNLISTYIPLKIYSPNDSIILIDEPEMSFYPDIQRQLIDLYTDVGINNQLIVATHSPLIASSFEPWEVVELKFDKDNQICRELYYPTEEENHVDNYTVDPRMLTWTGILTDVFDLKEDSNFTFREEKLMEYATLKSEIKQMASQEEKEKAFEKLKKVSKILGIYN